jgi:hypothetical protein
MNEANNVDPQIMCGIGVVGMYTHSMQNGCNVIVSQKVEWTGTAVAIDAYGFIGRNSKKVSMTKDTDSSINWVQNEILSQGKCSNREICWTLVEPESNMNHGDASIVVCVEDVGMRDKAVFGVKELEIDKNKCQWLSCTNACIQGIGNALKVLALFKFGLSVLCYTRGASENAKMEPIPDNMNKALETGNKFGFG